MHERNRKRLCRLLLVTCCALPTLFTLGLVTYRSTPWYRQARISWAEQRFLEQFGLKLSIDRIEDVAPGVLSFYGVVAIDPETGMEVGKAERVSCLPGESPLRVSVQKLSLRSFTLGKLGRVFHERLMSRTDLTIHATARSLSVYRIAGGGYEFRNAGLRLEHCQDLTTLEIQWENQGPRKNAPLWASIVRDRSQAVPLTRVELNCEKDHLPCGVFSECLEDLQRLGNGARFSGHLAFQDRGGAWSFARSSECTFQDIDLSGVRSGMTGIASLNLRELAFDQQLRRLAGTLSLEQGGTIATELLERGEVILGLQIDNQARSRAANEGTMHVGKLKLEFAMDERALALNLYGQSASGDLILSRAAGNLPLINIARMIAPKDSVEVPFTAETARIIRLLPFPAPTVSKQPITQAQTR
jgi:hypothetical protein